jgi:hypothetical protein
MIDSKTVQEVQKELTAAVQRGHEQVRKGQERVRKGQEQVRKSREAVTEVVSELAKTVQTAIPAGRTVHIPTRAEARAHAREMASHAITVQRDLADRAWHAAGPYAERFIAAQRDLADRARRAGVAEQVAAAQRTLAERVIEAARVATPFVAEGRARLSHLVSARAEAGKPEPAADGAGDPELAEVRELVVPPEVAAPAKAEPTATTARPKTTTGKPKATTAKPGPTKASTAGATRTSKPRTPKK